MAKGYTTEVLVEAEILQTIDTNSTPTTAQVAQWIEEAEAEIDEISETSFSSVTSTDTIIPFDREVAFITPIINAFAQNVRADALIGACLENSFFLQDTCGIQRRPIQSITNMCVNTSTTFGTEADNFVAITENTGSGGDFIVDCRTGRVKLLQCRPLFGHPRGIKTTFVYGYTAAVPEIIKKLATKMVARRVLGAKANAAQFESSDSFTIEGISRSKNTAQTVIHLKKLEEEIDILWDKVIGKFRVEVARV